MSPSPIRAVFITRGQINLTGSMPNMKKDGLTYTTVSAEYFAKRGLKRYAGPWSLWALGVGAVISGDFFGWNFGLAAGGFGGLLVATCVIAILYVCLCYCIAELSPALPHAGGAYSFGRTTMGPWGGFITGLAENMEYVLTPAVISAQSATTSSGCNCRRPSGGRWPTASLWD